MYNVDNNMRMKGKLIMSKIKVTIFNENLHDKEENVKAVYPNGMHGAIKECLDADGRFETKIALQDMPSHGLTDDVLNNTDVLFWWGHIIHDKVDDAIVEKVYQRVLKGMGLVVLHSGHFSKIFKKLMGTGCNLKWRETGDLERVWVVKPSHPIVAGLGEYFELPHEETYGEHFDIPAPDEVVFAGPVRKKRRAGLKLGSGMRRAGEVPTPTADAEAFLSFRRGRPLRRPAEGILPFRPNPHPPRIHSAPFS